MTKLKKLHLTLVALLILASLLAACGDSTTTTAPTTAASTTATTKITAGSAISTTAAISNTAGSAISTTVATAATKTAAIITTTTTATSAVPGEIYDAGGISYLDPRPNYQKAPAGNKGGNLNLAAASDAKSLHPYLTTDATSTDWQGFIYSGSFYDVDLKSGTPTVNFRVADALKVSADKLTYTFTLKDGLKWSDGKPITSADYEWTYKQALDPANNYPYVKDFTDVLESVTAPDAKTVVFKLKVADLYGIAKTGLVPLPKHIWEGKNWGDATQNAEINSPTVVSGPWKLKEWKRGQYITFVRNDNSTIWPVPQLESVTVQIVSSRTVQVQKLKAGELDAIDLNATEYDEAKKATNASVLEYFSFQASWSFIGFNFRRSYLQDLELRKALAYATPQKDIVDKLVLGLGQAIY
ncbi:MAG: ABC transporter substrate-binding protein, partial [Chloroflexota bacterium]